ncbi:MAG TPA: RNA polymerase sigma factor [Chthoniobacterales bacterium]|nr:RNA polymerase sigma factor [Chthoniobacterales bacterium]
MDEADFDLPDCLARIRNGEEPAARALFRRYYSYVAAIVRAHLPPRTDEEDLCQMTFVKAFGALDQYSGKGTFTHWLSRIAVTTCLNQLRFEKRRPEVRRSDLGKHGDLIFDHLISSTTELPDGDAAAAREVVESLLATLAPKERLVLTLLHLEDRPVSEVAAMTGWNQAVVKVRAFRARHKLRHAFAKIQTGDNHES